MFLNSQKKTTTILRRSSRITAANDATRVVDNRLTKAHKTWSVGKLVGMISKDSVGVTEALRRSQRKMNAP